MSEPEEDPLAHARELQRIEARMAQLQRGGRPMSDSERKHYYVAYFSKETGSVTVDEVWGYVTPYGLLAVPAEPEGGQDRYTYFPAQDFYEKEILAYERALELISERLTEIRQELEQLSEQQGRFEERINTLTKEENPEQS